MLQQLIVRVSTDLFAFGKLSEDAFTLLHDRKDFPTFHRILKNKGLEAANIWLKSQGLDVIQALCTEDAHLPIQGRWLITSMQSTIDGLHHVVPEEELRTYA